MTELDKHNFWVACETQAMLAKAPLKNGFYVIEEVKNSKPWSYLAEILFKELPEQEPQETKIIPEMGSIDSYEVADIAEVEILLISREKAFQIANDEYELIGLKFAPSTGVRPVIKKK